MNLKLDHADPALKAMKEIENELEALRAWPQLTPETCLSNWKKAMLVWQENRIMLEKKIIWLSGYFPENEEATERIWKIYQQILEENSAMITSFAKNRKFLDNNRI